MRVIATSPLTRPGLRQATLSPAGRGHDNCFRACGQTPPSPSWGDEGEGAVWLPLFGREILPVPVGDAYHHHVIRAQAHVILRGEVEDAPGAGEAACVLDGIANVRPLFFEGEAG